ncbi:hypothetical protein BC827DRAFT_1250413 [Russula dissimulans]|nr:hypothetical protein BC827DRAFT_1250413 [Russula dissimulans]
MQATVPISVFTLQAVLPTASPPSCPVSNLLENSQTCPTSATTASALYMASLTKSEQRHIPGCTRVARTVCQFQPAPLRNSTAHHVVSARPPRTPACTSHTYLCAPLVTVARATAYSLFDRKHRAVHFKSRRLAGPNGEPYIESRSQRRKA